jgi:hypothetical protein
MSPELRQEIIEVIEQLVSYVEGEFGYPGWEDNPAAKLCDRADKVVETVRYAGEIRS